MIRKVLLERVDEPTRQRVPIPYRNVPNFQSLSLVDQCDNVHTLCSTVVYYWGNFNEHQEDKVYEDNFPLSQE